MKKLFVFVLLLFFVVFPKGVVLADESSASATASPTAAMASNYTLPYPGILPDNPLYFLKVLRDNIVVFFISDPMKKSSFYLLQSDKRLEAAWYLLKRDNNHDDLVLSTLSKSTNYLSQAVDQVTLAQKSGLSVNGQIDSLKNAMTTHLIVMNTIVQTPGLKNREDFIHEQKRLENLANVVSKLSSK